MPNDDEESQEAISGERKTRESILKVRRWRMQLDLTILLKRGIQVGGCVEGGKWLDFLDGNGSISKNFCGDNDAMDFGSCLGLKSAP
jgi:hypothetical protein